MYIIILLKIFLCVIVGLNKPFQGGATGMISPKNQLALMLYFFRVYLKCKKHN